jgi:glycosyl transferase family 25
VLTYLINLDRAVERRERMAALLDGLGLAYERIPAVDAATERDGLREAFDFHDGTTATDAEMICVLSHMRAWERFLETDAPAATFLEDDVHFAPTYSAVTAGLRVQPDDEAIWRLETHLATVTADRRPLLRLGGTAVYEIHTNHAGAAAYVLSRAAARRLLAERRLFRRSIDTELFDPERRSIGPIRVLQCDPAPCVQDDKLNGRASAPYLASHVGDDRNDVITGWLRQEPAAVRTIKALGRPVYRRAASLVLGLRGRQRLAVRFG